MTNSERAVLEQVADGVWLVRAELGQGSVCLYVVKGSKLALVDTGYSNHPGDAIEPVLHALDLRLDEVDYILNTHGHADHLGGNAVVKDASGALVHLHRDDLPMAGGPEALLHSPFEVLSAIRDLGWEDDIAARESLLRTRVGRDVGIDRVLDEGDTIDLGNGMVFSVVHTPGHTPGSVTFVNEATGLALVGDAVRGFGGPPGGLPFYFEPGPYETTLAKLADLPITTMAMGHPSRWSGEAGLGSPVRVGPEVKQTLIDSQTFIPVIQQAAAESLAKGPGSFEEHVRWALDALPEPFRITLRADGRFPGFCAATMRAYLNH